MLYVPFVAITVCPSHLSMSSNLSPEPGIRGDQTGYQHNQVILYFARSCDLYSKTEELITIPATEIQYLAGLCVLRTGCRHIYAIFYPNQRSDSSLATSGLALKMCCPFCLHVLPVIKYSFPTLHSQCYWITGRLFGLEYRWTVKAQTWCWH